MNAAVRLRSQRSVVKNMAKLMTNLPSAKNTLYFQCMQADSVSAIAAKIAAFNQSLKDCLLYQPHRQPH